MSKRVNNKKGAKGTRGQSTKQAMHANWGRYKFARLLQHGIKHNTKRLELKIGKVAMAVKRAIMGADK